VLQFPARRSRDPVEVAQEAIDLARKIEERRAWLENQLKWERHYSRKVERELEAERKARFSFSDDDVLTALRLASIEGHVRAKGVARIVFPDDDLSHSVVIRVGFALGRLERAGLATRLEVRGHDRWRHSNARDGFQWKAVDA